MSKLSSNRRIREKREQLREMLRPRARPRRDRTQLRAANAEEAGFIEKLVSGEPKQEAPGQPTIGRLQVVYGNYERRVRRCLAEAARQEQGGNQFAANAQRAKAGIEPFDCPEARWPELRRLSILLEGLFGSLEDTFDTLQLPGLCGSNIRRLRGKLLLDGIGLEEIDEMTIEEVCERLTREEKQKPRVPKKVRDKETAKPTPIEIVPGGFKLWGGKKHELVGKPLDILRELLAAPGYCCTLDALRSAVWPNDESAIAYPDQAVRDNTSTLRITLRNAMKSQGVSFSGASDRAPVLSTGRGKHLSYGLVIPSPPSRKR